LARDYAAQSVVFLEQDVDNPVGSRYDRWWVAYGGSGPVYLPLVMVDSGHQISNGSVSFYNVYKGMVDAELARAAQAYIVASCWRVGNRVRISGQITNLSGVTLSSYLNEATIHAIVYEDAHVGVTDRYVRGATSTAIASNLASGSTMTFTLETSDLSGVNWDKLHVVALADYQPAGFSDPYDMLQATRASWIADPSWSSVPGLTASTPALAWNPVANNLQMVVRAADDSIWKATFDSSGNFNNDWSPIPGSTRSAPALAWNPVANELQIVVQASNNSLWAGTFNSNGVFNNDWTSIPGSTPSSPALAWDASTSDLGIVVRASGDSIWFATFDSSGNFNNDWFNISGLTPSSPGMAYLPSIGYLGIVVRASDDSIWRILY
jgi:hypothetical protein